jgi:RimJ/RimL family protein N-acetyltransferase
MNSLLDVLAGAAADIAPDPSHAVEVIPYNGCHDSQADSFLPWMWKRMQEDDLVDYYFPGQRDTGFATFVRLMSGDAQVALFKITDDSSGKTWDTRIPGFITWTATRMGASDMIIAGFIFFRKWWDHHTTDAAARAAFAGWFAMEPRINCVLGLCPSLHAAAIRYNKRIGLREIGRIPQAHIFKGQPCDAILYGLTRAQWEGGA